MLKFSLEVEGYRNNINSVEYLFTLIVAENLGRGRQAGVVGSLYRISRLTGRLQRDLHYPRSGGPEALPSLRRGSHRTGNYLLRRTTAAGASHSFPRLPQTQDPAAPLRYTEAYNLTYFIYNFCCFWCYSIYLSISTNNLPYEININCNFPFFYYLCFHLSFLFSIYVFRGPKHAVVL